MNSLLVYYMVEYFDGALKSLSVQKAAIPAMPIVMIALVPIINKLIRHFKYTRTNFEDRNYII